MVGEPAVTRALSGPLGLPHSAEEQHQGCWRSTPAMLQQGRCPAPHSSAMPGQGFPKARPVHAPTSWPGIVLFPFPGGAWWPELGLPGCLDCPAMWVVGLGRPGLLAWLLLPCSSQSPECPQPLWWCDNFPCCYQRNYISGGSESSVLDFSFGSRGRSLHHYQGTDSWLWWQWLWLCYLLCLQVSWLYYT